MIPQSGQMTDDQIADAAIVGIHRDKVNGHDPFGSTGEVHRGQMRFAERFAHRYGGHLVHAHGFGWHHWDTNRWAPCQDGAPTRAVKDLLTDAYAELAHLPSDKSKELFTDIRGCSTAAGTEGVLKLAGSYHPCTVAADLLDTDTNLINTPSGTVDLTTGDLQPASPGHWLTKRTGGHFDPTATSAEWNTFLERILPSQEVRDFVARLFGYALLGSPGREQIMGIFTGTGANGKSKLEEAVRSALGDYAIEVDPEILMESKSGRHLTFLLELKGRRVVFCSETERNRRFAESTMKRLTDGTRLQANKMHKDPIYFDPSHVLIMTTNHLPVVSGDDDAVWRRLLVVPFDVTIPVAERDPKLGEKLTTPDAQAAVLAWVWHGYRQYLERGLAPPEAVRVRTEAYRTESDALGRFLTECTQRAVGTYVPCAELFSKWSGWCAENGEVAGSLKSFGLAMATKGVQQGRTNRGKVYTGISLPIDEDE